MTQRQPQSQIYMSRGKRWGISLIVTVLLLLLVLGAFYVTVSAHNGGSFKDPNGQHQHVDDGPRPDHKPEGQPQPTAETNQGGTDQIPAEQQVPGDQIQAPENTDQEMY